MDPVLRSNTTGTMNEIEPCHGLRHSRWMSQQENQIEPTSLFKYVLGSEYFVQTSNFHQGHSDRINVRVHCRNLNRQRRLYKVLMINRSLADSIPNCVNEIVPNTRNSKTVLKRGSMVVRKFVLFPAGTVRGRHKRFFFRAPTARA